MYTNILCNLLDASESCTCPPLPVSLSVLSLTVISFSMERDRTRRRLGTIIDFHRPRASKGTLDTLERRVRKNKGREKEREREEREASYLSIIFHEAPITHSTIW